jgi:mycothiol synthase
MANSFFTIRTYSPDDFENYLQLHVESEQLDTSGRFLSARGLAESLGRPNFNPQNDLFVAETNGKIIGYMSVTIELGIQRALVDCLVHPLHRRKGTATQLVARGMQRAKECGVKVVQISVPETNVAAKNLLVHLGFRFIRYFLEMRLDIANNRLPTVQQGRLKSRRLRYGEADQLTEIQNRCFADAWGFNPNTNEEIAYRLNMSGRSPEDVILTYSGEKSVGYCWSILNAEENAALKVRKGLIHMLGVDPDYRQQEIGKAILLNGLSYLIGKGIDVVELTVDSENPAACSLYESVGFEVYAKTEWYEKTLV